MTVLEKEKTSPTSRLEALLSLRRTNPQELSRLFAEKCVERGSRWLTRNAPVRRWGQLCLWRGKSRIQMRYTEESVLAMVFDEPRFADQFGYVQDYIVAKHFFGDRWQAPSARLGFATGFSGYKPAPRRHPGIVVTNELLNAAWASFVENPPESWSFYHRYPTEFDKRFAEMDFDFPATREPFWKRWFGSRVSA